MGDIAPPVYVQPPAPDPSRFGLFSVATIVGDEPDRWKVGYQYEPVPCEVAELASYNCDNEDEAGYPLAVRDGEGLVEVEPFLVYGSYGCKTLSRPIDEAEQRARWHLQMGEERAVERAIAAGGFGNAPTFQGADDITPATGAVSVARGFALLESLIGQEYGGIGTIHAPRLLVPAISGGRLAERQGQRLETLVGTYVVAGGGYDLANVGPDGSPPGEYGDADGVEAWLYATSRPIVRRGEVYITPDRDHFVVKPYNDVEIIAQRAYAVSWECVLGAVRVSLDTLEGI